MASKQTQQTQNFWKRHNKLWKRLAITAGVIWLLILAVYVAFQVSPWPNSLLIRYEFTQGGEKTSKALEKYVPNNITQVENQQYRQGDSDAFLDVFYPTGATQPLPTVVWVHGGAWVSGDKDEVDNYLKIVASYGFTVVGVNYSIAPEKQYPTPIVQLNSALDYLQKHAARLNIDDKSLALAGDSAGSQIVAQMANIITSPVYAAEMSIKPSLQPEKLKATLLNCGAYDLALPDYNGPFGDFLHTVLWAYSGKKDFLHDPQLKPASVVNYVTSKFPPTFITAGNIDPLLAQSTEFAKKLETLGVSTAPLFYPDNQQPPLNHEYQFNLDTDAGKQALTNMVDFLHKHM